MFQLIQIDQMVQMVLSSTLTNLPLSYSGHTRRCSLVQPLHPPRYLKPPWKSLPRPRQRRGRPFLYQRATGGGLNFYAGAPLLFLPDTFFWGTNDSIGINPDLLFPAVSWGTDVGTVKWKWRESNVVPIDEQCWGAGCFLFNSKDFKGTCNWHARFSAK